MHVTRSADMKLKVEVGVPHRNAGPWGYHRGSVAGSTVGGASQGGEVVVAGLGLGSLLGAEVVVGSLQWLGELPPLGVGGGGGAGGVEGVGDPAILVQHQVSGGPDPRVPAGEVFLLGRPSGAPGAHSVQLEVSEREFGSPQVSLRRPLVSPVGQFVGSV